MTGPDGPAILGPGIVRDHNGDTWAQASAVCGHGTTCRHAKHRAAQPLLGRDVTCKMIRAWAVNHPAQVATRRVDGDTWYLLADLNRAELAARDAPIKRARRPPN